MKFNKLYAIRDTGKRNKSGNSIWLFKCDCGNEKEIVFTQVKNGYTKSCGCLQKEKVTKHGEFSGRCKRTTSTYRSWLAMKTRCLNSNTSYYKDYGGRGITVCERWIDSFKSFLDDMGERPEGMTLDRIDNDGDYTLENTRWATYKEQQNNQRYNKGNSKLNEDSVRNIKKLIHENMTLKQIGDMFGVTKYCIHSIKTGKNWRNIYDFR